MQASSIKKSVHDLIVSIETLSYQLLGVVGSVEDYLLNMELTCGCPRVRGRHFATTVHSKSSTDHLFLSTTRRQRRIGISQHF
jgi:hypothetical protein